MSRRCGICRETGHNRQTCPAGGPSKPRPPRSRYHHCGYCGEHGHQARHCAHKPTRRAVPVVEPTGAWNGAGENLRGTLFGPWAVEDPAPSDGRGVRVWARCACGKRGVRHVAELARGTAPPCKVCGASATAPARPSRPSRPRRQPRADFRPAERLEEMERAETAAAPTTPVPPVVRPPGPVTNTELAAAVVDLRNDSDPAAPGWRVVDAWLRGRFPSRGDADHPDIHQLTLISAARSLDQLRHLAPHSVAGWLRRIRHHRAADVARGRRRRREVSTCFGGDSSVSRAEGAPVLRAPHRLDDLLGELDRHVEAMVATRRRDASGRRPSVIRRRTMARAAVLRRVFDYSAGEIVDELGQRASSPEQVWKWAERGRGIVLAAIERWRATTPGDPWVEEVTEALEEVIGWRRADAGVPRGPVCTSEAA